MSAGISANIGGVMRELGGGLRVFEGSTGDSSPYTCECPFEPLFILTHHYRYDGVGFGINGAIYHYAFLGTSTAKFLNHSYLYSDGVFTFDYPCSFIAFG